MQPDSSNFETPAGRLWCPGTLAPRQKAAMTEVDTGIAIPLPGDDDAPLPLTETHATTEPRRALSDEVPEDGELNLDVWAPTLALDARTDRKSTRLNSSHLGISYAVFCL